MGKLWNWFRQPLNLAAITAIAGALAFIWVQIIVPMLRSPTPAAAAPAAAPTPVTQTAVANGGTAINNQNGSVNAGTAAATAPAAAPTAAVDQNAHASQGGSAVNNNGGRVVINGAGKPP
jgi:hypothetical protein